MRRLRSFLEALFDRRRLRQEMDDEWRFHREERMSALQAEGRSLEEAARQARIEFGSPEAWKDVGLEARGVRTVDGLRSDLLHATRGLIRQPGFALTAILTLALGIGATTAMFSVARVLLLRPRPYPHADRLVRINDTVTMRQRMGTGLPLPGVSVDEAEILRARAASLVHLGDSRASSLITIFSDNPAQLDGRQVMPDLLAALGVPPQYGRLFRNDEASPGTSRVVILSHSTWRRVFGADPSVVGRSLVLQVDSTRAPFSIVGVMPSGFRYPDDNTAYWVPFVPFEDPGMRQTFRLALTARLADGVTTEAATAEVNTILRSLRRRDFAAGTSTDSAGPPPEGPRPPASPLPPGPPPQLVDAARQAADLLTRGNLAPASPKVADRDVNAHVSDESLATFVVSPWREENNEHVGRAIVFLTAAAIVVLLIASVNVANLFLARSVSRHRELATHRALGASPGRLFRRALLESLLLAVPAGIAGSGIAVGTIALFRMLAAVLPRRDLTLGFDIGIPGFDQVTIDYMTVLMAAAIASISGLMCGVVPALRQLRGDPAEVLRASGSRPSGLRISRRPALQLGLVVGEIAMATTLLLVGTLFFTSFSKLLHVELGYDPSHVLTFRVVVPTVRSADERRAFADVLVRRLGLLPGVSAAGAAGSLPLTLSESIVSISETPPAAGPSSPAPPPPPPGAMPPPGTAVRNVVSQDLLAALGTRVVRGRGFDDGDQGGSPLVMLVNEAVVRSGLVGDRPIGKQVYAIGRLPWTIVGVVEDVVRAPGAAPTPQVYFDRRQAPAAPQYFVVRTAGDPMTIAPQVRSLVAELDPQGTTIGMVSMKEVVSNSLSRQRLLAVLIGGFAALAVVLAAIGIYSMVGFVVAQRTQEIGIRAALGARRGQIHRLIVGQTAVLAAIGIAIGVTGAALLMRQLAHQLYGLSAVHPLIFVAAPVAFAAITVAAAIVPARRATSINPMDVLRAQ